MRKIVELKIEEIVNVAGGVVAAPTDYRVMQSATMMKPATFTQASNLTVSSTSTISAIRYQ